MIKKTAFDVLDVGQTQSGKCFPDLDDLKKNRSNGVEVVQLRF